jgi:hypothetical protein
MEPSTPSSSLEPARACGTCTACCDGWLKIEVYGHKVDRGQPCPFSSGHDCTIYDRRPQVPCREFECAWRLRNSPLPEWMRPDKADTIVLASNFVWRGVPVDVAVPIGERPKRKALEWLKAFATARQRLLLFAIAGDWYAFGPPAFQTEMHERIGRGEQPWS